MNPLYFFRANRWALFLNADKGGAAGGPAQKAPTVAELAQQVKDLQAEKQSLTTERDDAKKQVTALEGEKAALITERDDAKKQVTALEGEKAALIKERDEAKQSVTTLEGEKQTAIKERDDARVDLTKAREANAKAGIVAPPNDAAKKEGEKQAGDDKTKSPQQRLADIFNAKP